MRRAELALAAVVILAMSACLPRGAAEVTLVRYYQTPDKPTPDDDVTITLEVSDASNVSKAYVAWCQSNPDLCFTPKEMRYIGANTYSLGLGKFKDGQEIKFNLTVMLKDGNSTTTPDVHFKVEKVPPSNGGGDHNNTTNGNTSRPGDNGNPNVVYYALGAVTGVVVIAAVAALVLRGRGKPKGG